MIVVVGGNKLIDIYREGEGECFSYFQMNLLEMAFNSYYVSVAHETPDLFQHLLCCWHGRVEQFSFFFFLGDHPARESER